jgi:hypothetical protein
MMHLQHVQSVIGFCSSHLKTQRLQQRFYSWTDHALLGLGSPAFTTDIYGEMKICRRFNLAINDCLIGADILLAHINGCDEMDYGRCVLQYASSDMVSTQWCFST